MKRAPSALVSIGGFGIAVATLSVATTAAIVILAPQPPVQRISVGEAVAALRAPKPGFERRLVAEPPHGARLMMLEGLIAAELGRRARDVQVTWPGRTERIGVHVGKATVSTMLPPGARALPPSFVLLRRARGRFEMVPPGAASGAVRKALIDLPMTGFTASVRQSDGRWLSVEPARPFLGGWQRNILIALAVSLLLLAPIAWFFARRLTRPFRALAGALDDDTVEAVPQEGPRELRDAAAAIGAMRNRLAIEATERARMLTAIAHDLRTPLTGLRLRIEATPEPQRARMVADIERMQAMIGEVLAFAREAATPADVLDVRPLLAAIVEEMAGDKAAVRLLPGDDAQILVAEPAFRRAVENLVRNAIDYAGGGTIAVRNDEATIAISIADDGPGIPAADRERLLRPFERGDASRNRDTGGVGLGLSIVRDFVARHRGEFTLADAPGGGTIATLRLPSA
ncbi:HAMP domain-containing sensor histidine kinase [Sphingomonas sp. CFBP8993]|uniref:sensor histidine kinase n=1 Tax=Sphingomonas sp. CFBP8993 TaxID=3096526 RepID=UPI002A6A1AC6|nr:HAMP domain-containing sensor histidine kinase [Sphingomonas sp. CFBP8993]MDY0958850.1 HAMP domain-containing sensor histidine kinase [Sphingomonas sp. CFBP8993]